MTKTYTQEQVDALVANASRQMRDAAVKVCRENAEAWGRLNADDEKHGAERCADEIAALPIPGEEK